MQRDGYIELIHFPFDRDSRSSGQLPNGVPAAAKWAELNCTWDELAQTGATWADLQAAKELDQILTYVGRENRADGLHVLSAVRSECQAFLTVDEGDILSKREGLENITGLKFFHPGKDQYVFASFVGAPMPEGLPAVKTIRSDGRMDWKIAAPAAFALLWWAATSAMILGGGLVLLLQIGGWLQTGEWASRSVVDGLAWLGLAKDWAQRPTILLGLWRLLDWIPVGPLGLGLGWLMSRVFD